MSSGKKICLWGLIPCLIGCTSLTVKETDLVASADAVVASADAVVEIKFVESAPKDRFVITNMGSCALEGLTLELDLSQSAGNLIFDTTATGAGVEVFQPFEVEEGDIVPLAADGVRDGDDELALHIANLGPGNTASFTIDVDDTLPNGELGQIRVADSEISGASVNITVGDAETAVAQFSGSTARATLPACPSA